MPDLTFNVLAESLPEGAIYMDSEANMAISIGLVMGQPDIQSSAESVSEFMVKLLTALNTAQGSYNAEYGANIQSYPAGSWSTPTKAADGQFYSRRSFTVAVNVPLNVDEATAV